MAAANFWHVNDYADTWVCLDYEGVPMPGKNLFDDNTYSEMRSFEKIKMVNMFTVDARKLAFSKLFRKPVREI